MDSAEYRQLLRHPKWQRKRLRIFNRDQWKCVACGVDDQELHVHHGYYAAGKRPWEYPDSDLVTFCVDCHHRFHNAESKQGIVIPYVYAQFAAEDDHGNSCDVDVIPGMIFLFEDTWEQKENHEEDYYIVSTFDGFRFCIDMGSALFFKNPGLRGMSYVKWSLAVQSMWEHQVPA